MESDRLLKRKEKMKVVVSALMTNYVYRYKSSNVFTNESVSAKSFLSHYLPLANEVLYIYKGIFFTFNCETYLIKVYLGWKFCLGDGCELMAPTHLEITHTPILDVTSKEMCIGAEMRTPDTRISVVVTDDLATAPPPAPCLHIHTVQHISPQ